jgi:hypothetical protein
MEISGCKDRQENESGKLLGHPFARSLPILEALVIFGKPN